MYLTSSRNLKIGSVELFRNPEAQLPDALIYGSAMPNAIAPEVVEESMPYTERSDAWALGRVLFEMASGEPLPAPRNHRVEAGIMRAIRGKYGFKIWMALRMMLAELPNERASLGDVYEYLKFDPMMQKIFPFPYNIPTIAAGSAVVCYWPRI